MAADTAIIQPLRVKIIYDANTKDLKNLNKELNNIKSVTNTAVKSADNLGESIAKTGDSASKTKKSSAGLKTAFGEMKVGAEKLKGNLDRLTMTYLGLGLSIVQMVREAHAQNQKILGWHNMFNDMSDATGNASQAVRIYTSTWNKSKASLGTIQSAMKSLNSAGIMVGSTMEDLTLFVSNLHQASGLSFDTLGNFTGELISMWQVSKDATKEMVSSIVALGDTFKFTTSQIELVMKTTQTAIEKLGAFFKDTTESSKALTKGIAAGIGVMRKFGVSIQKAQDFMGKLMDPESFAENQALMSRLGFSFQEQMDMMENAGNKEMFFDKLMTRLPELSKQITSLQNPMARLQFSQSLGVPLEIAQKMAKATGSEIQALMEEYKLAAKEQDAVKKKEEKAKADQARFGEALEFIKMKALFPMMQFIQKIYPVFFNLAGKLGNLFSKYATVVVSILEKLLPILEKLIAGDMKGVMSAIGDAIVGVAPIIGNAIGDVIWALLSKIPDLISGAFSGLSKVFAGILSPVLGKGEGIMSKVLAGVTMAAGGYAIFSKVKTGFDNFKEAFKGKMGTKSNPMWTKDTDEIAGKGKLSKLIEIMKNPKAAIGSGIAKVGQVAAAGKSMALAGAAKVGALLTNPVGWGILAVAAITATAVAANSAANEHNEAILSAEEKRERDTIFMKQQSGKQLNANEQKRLNELNQKYADNHKGMLGGLGLIGQKIASWWNDLMKTFSRWGKQISTWMSINIVQPIRMFSLQVQNYIQNAVFNNSISKAMGSGDIASIVKDSDEITQDIDKAINLGAYGKAKLEAAQKAVDKFKADINTKKLGAVAGGIAADKVAQWNTILQAQRDNQQVLAENQAADIKARQEADAARKKEAEEQAKRDKQMQGTVGAINGKLKDEKATTSNKFEQYFSLNTLFDSKLQFRVT